MADLERPGQVASTSDRKRVDQAARTPYAGLTPDCILDALESVGLRGDGRMLALNSYENRVYQLYLETGEVLVAKFYRPARWSDAQILEEHAFARELADAEVPAVAPIEVLGRTLHEHAGFRFALFPRKGGRPPETDAEGVLPRIGALLGRMHARGAAAPFRQRQSFTVETFGDASVEYLQDSGMIPIELTASWRAAASALLQAIHQAWSEVSDARRLRIHGDFHPGNILWTDAGAHLVDLDDCVMGPAMQDFWMLLSGDGAEMSRQLAQLLEGYEQFRDFDRRELRLLEALRGMRLVHYSAWIARRWGDPAFPAAFPWFNSQRYWQDRILEMREQIAAISEAVPIVV